MLNANCSGLTPGCCCVLWVVFLFAVPMAGLPKGSGQFSPRASAESAPIKRASYGTPTATLEPEVKFIIENSEGLPPEFESDINLQLVESGRISNASLRTELIDRAFRAASLAQQIANLQPIAGTATDSRQGLLGTSLFATRLDRLSLQARAVRQMLALHPGRARAMFEELELQFPPVGCRQRLTYKPSAVYQTLAEVARRSFTEPEQRQGPRRTFLSHYVGDLKSHSQVAPVASMLSESELSGAELRELVPAYAAALVELRGDAQSFTSEVAVGYADTFDAWKRLLRSLASSEVSSGQLPEAFRTYLVENFKGERCRNEFAETHPNGLPAAVGQFNHSFERALRASGLAAISPKELKNFKEVDAEKDELLWKSADSSRMLGGLQKLRDNDRGKSLTPVQKSSALWSANLADYLVQLHAWSGTEEDEAHFFHERAFLYEGLVDLVPGSEERTKILESYIEFLEQNSFQQESRVEWFVHAKRLLDGLTGKNTRSEVLQAFLNSRDRVLSLYARLAIWKSQRDVAPVPTDPKRKQLQ